MKRFTMTITDENDKFNINTRNEGFNALEIIGALKMKINDIMCQIEHPSKFERILVENGQECIIKEEEL